MDSLQIRAILAGLFFGAWPLFMNRSGLNGNTATFAFTVIVLISIIPFSINGLSAIVGANWVMAVAAGIAGAIGLLVFNSMLAEASVVNVGTLFVIMIVAQISVPAIYKVVVSGELSLAQGSGFVLAVIAGILLTKG